MDSLSTRSMCSTGRHQLASRRIDDRLYIFKDYLTLAVVGWVYLIRLGYRQHVKVRP